MRWRWPSSWRGRERGSAVLAAVFASACFALLAAQAARTSRSAIASADAGLVHARLAAAAQGGLALAIAGLSSDDHAGRWDIDRTPHTAELDGASLVITVEDERGKAPLNAMTPSEVAALFQEAGADPVTVEALTRAFLQRRDPNLRGVSGAPTSLGAQATSGSPGPTAAPGVSSAGSGFETIEDLRLLPGITPELYAAIAPSVTVEAGDNAFEPRTATPLALAVMGGQDASPAAAIERGRDLAGERTALDARPPLSLRGRALTIRVEASDGHGGRTGQASIVELTGRADHPYVVRQRPS